MNARDYYAKGNPYNALISESDRDDVVIMNRSAVLSCACFFCQGCASKRFSGLRAPHPGAAMHQLQSSHCSASGQYVCPVHQASAHVQKINMGAPMMGLPPVEIATAAKNAIQIWYLKKMADLKKSQRQFSFLIEKCNSSERKLYVENSRKCSFPALFCAASNLTRKMVN